MYDLYANYPKAMILWELQQRIEELLRGGQDPAGFVNIVPLFAQHGTAVYLVDSEGRYRFYRESPD